MHDHGNGGFDPRNSSRRFWASCSLRHPGVLHPARLEHRLTPSIDFGCPQQ